jgi:hypothetical protein
VASLPQLLILWFLLGRRRLNIWLLVAVAVAAHIVPVAAALAVLELHLDLQFLLATQ